LWEDSKFIRGLGSLHHQIHASLAAVCSGNVHGNALHADAGAIQGRSCFLIVDEVGAEEERVTHTYKHKITRYEERSKNYCLLIE
jgi:hypothetical protein